MDLLPQLSTSQVYEKSRGSWKEFAFLDGAADGTRSITCTVISTLTRVVFWMSHSDGMIRLVSSEKCRSLGAVLYAFFPLASHV